MQDQWTAIENRNHTKGTIPKFNNANEKLYLLNVMHLTPNKVNPLNDRSACYLRVLRFFLFHIGIRDVNRKIRNERQIAFLTFGAFNQKYTSFFSMFDSLQLVWRPALRVNSKHIKRKRNVRLTLTY